MLDILRKRILENMVDIAGLENYYCVETVSENCIRYLPRPIETVKNNYPVFPEIKIDAAKKQASLDEINLDDIRAKIRKMKGL